MNKYPFTEKMSSRAVADGVIDFLMDNFGVVLQEEKALRLGYNQGNKNLKNTI